MNKEELIGLLRKLRNNLCLFEWIIESVNKYDIVAFEFVLVFVLFSMISDRTNNFF